MGYTHYWYYNPSLLNETSRAKAFIHAAVKIGKAARHIESAAGVVVRGWDGRGEAVFFDKAVSFNGDDSRGESHESFVVERDKQRERGGFNFCKTARKPYDILVCYALMAFFDEFQDKNVFSYCSDGGEGDWGDAQRLYSELNCREAPRLSETGPDT